MPYENAPATKLLATHCAVCARPLVDAKSVELGIGPDCRRKHGFDLNVSDAARTEANAIVYAIALLDKRGIALAAPSLARLRLLGFSQLADRIAERLPEVKPAIAIALEGGMYIVSAPYDARHVERMRRVPGRRFNWERKVDMVPVASKRALWDALRASFAGALAQGPQGAFVLA